MTTITISDLQKNISKIFNKKNLKNPIKVIAHNKTKGVIISEEEFNSFQNIIDYFSVWSISFIEPWTNDYEEIQDAIKNNKILYKKWDKNVNAFDFMKNLD